MRIVVLGCGRLGANVAELLDGEGHEVTIIDSDPESFHRLSRFFRGKAVAGIGIDEDQLQQVGMANADAFLALTEGDNTNLMASQIAKNVFHVPRVISQIKDPLRGGFYETLGIVAICPTAIGAEAIREAIIK